jgi:tetratricopeptide (TPR) repeat protein
MRKAGRARQKVHEPAGDEENMRREGLPSHGSRPEAMTRLGAWTHAFRPELVVAAVALLLRTFYLWEMRSSPVFRNSFGDGLVYDAWARGIAAGDWLGKGVFYQAPLYPYFLAAVHALFGPGLLAVRLAQILIGTASCVFMVQAGRRFFTPKIGLVAGLLLAFYPSAIFFDGLIQKSVLDVFFMTLLLVVMGSIHREDRPGLWFGFGLVLGGLLQTRENALVLLGVALFWLGVRQRPRPRAGLARAILLLAGWALVVLPFGVRNLVVGGEFHLTTSQFGPNLYIGNNPAADGRYSPLRPGGGDSFRERNDNTELAEQALGRSLSPGEVSRYWTGRALDFITGHPGRWLALMARKWLMFWNREEIPDTDDQESYGNWSVILRALNRLFNFGVLLPLAAAGIFLTRRRWRELWILYATVLLYAGSVVLFIVLSRFRYPIVPILALFAAAGVVFSQAEFSRRGWRRLFPAAGVALLAAVIVNVPIVSKRTGNARAVMQNNLGGAAWNTNHNAEEAAAYFQEAIRLSPAFAEPHKNLGIVLQMTGRWEEAMVWYRKALTIQPDDPNVLEGLGMCASNLGLSGEALDWFRRALALNPRLAAAHYGMGLNLKKKGLRAEANLHFAEAARLDPSYAGR